MAKTSEKTTDNANNGEIRLNLLEPRATEKTYGEQTKRVYVFPVERSMSKQAIAEMVEKEFNVKVTGVKTLIRKGKKTRFSRGKRAYPGTTYRRDRKFAYVRLAEGDSIQVFEEPETSAKDASVMSKAAEKLAERAEKQAAKEKAREEKKAAKAEKMADKRAKSEADKNAGKEKK